MHKRLIFILFVSLITEYGFAQNFTIQIDTLREYRLHLPATYDSNQVYPLLFAFHGGYGFNWQFENETNFSDYSDSLEFIVVYPQAIGTTRSWNTGSCCGWAFNNGIDDVLFIETLIDSLTSKYSIDADRIYSTGFSSGAMFTYTLGCKLSAKIAAIAPVSSSMIIDQCTPDCTPVPVIHLHAEPDSSALFHGGYSSNLFVPFYYPPVDSVMHEWSLKNGCNSWVDTIPQANGLVVYKWNNCANNTFQELWLADDGGHKWPGTAGTGTLSGESATQDFYATEVVWNFLSQFQKNCQPVSISEITIAQEIYTLYPNPSSGLFNIVGDLSLVSEIKVRDKNGRRIQVLPKSNSIDVTHLNPSLYFLEIVLKEKVVVLQLIKQ